MSFKTSNFGEMTYVMAMAFGIPLGMVVTNGMDDPSLLVRVLITMCFAVMGGIVGYVIDQDDSDDQKIGNHETNEKAD